jgi:uncharacterized protein with beta-barrel porin domain
VVVGLDRRVTRNVFAGVAFAYDNAYQSFSTIQSNSQIDAFRTTLYGGWRSGNVFADGYAGYTKNWHNTRRDINIGTFNEVAKSKYSDNMFSTGLEIGQNLSFGRSHLAPSVGFHYIHLSTPSITEAGAGDANLHVHSNSYNSLRMPIGARMSRDISSGGIVWTPEVRAFYICELLDTSARARTSFDGARGASFAADSGNWGRNSARFGAILNAGLTDRLNFRVDYDYEVFDHTAVSEFGATLGVNW